MAALEDLIRSNISRLVPYSSARDEFSGTGAVLLDANENPFGYLNRYPDPYQKALKEKISELKGINPANVFLGNGSDEIIDLCFRIFCEPEKSKVLSFTPTYGMYEVSADINNVEMLNLPLDANFQIQEEQALDYLDDEDLKMIFICSPNNPTGNLMNPSSIKLILNGFRGIVIIDEAYIDFSESESWLTRLSAFPNLIITQTFSKAWGLAGARIGMAFAIEQIISFLNKVKPPYNISSLNQKQALKQLDQKVKVDLILQDLAKEKSRLEKELKQLKGVQKIYSSDANFILVKIDYPNQVYHQLLDKKIIVRNRNSVVEGCLRITVGKAAENKKLIKELKNIIK